MNPDGENRRHVDPKHIHYLYKLSHPELDLTFKRLRETLLEQLEEFRTRVICSLNNLNYFRYMRAFPQDDITFVFREKMNASVSEARFDEKEQVLNRMANF